MNSGGQEIFEVESENAMLDLGQKLAGRLAGGQVWTLSGELGAGKTTLVRGMLRGLGFQGRVKSPSYGLVESYELGSMTVHHLDLYRLGEPDELEFIGIEELGGPESVLLIEWPERGGGRLPEPTHPVSIAFSEQAGRRVKLG